MRLKHVVDEIQFVLSKHCDDPVRQLVLHLAHLLGLRDQDISEGQFAYKRAVNSGADLEGLYRRFLTKVWSRYAWCIDREREVPDPVGSLLQRTAGEKYQTGEFSLTPSDVVHSMNRKVMPPEERTSGFRASLGHTISPENVIPVLDPTCGTGRIGLNFIAYYPTTVMWNVERDLDTYRIAVLNGRLLTPFTQVHRLFRWHTLWADSLLVDIRNQRNWELGANCWTPPDWRTTYTTTEGKTWADLERELGENHAYDFVVQDSTERAGKGG